MFLQSEKSRFVSYRYKIVIEYENTKVNQILFTVSFSAPMQRPISNLAEMMERLSFVSLCANMGLSRKARRCMTKIKMYNYVYTNLSKKEKKQPLCCVFHCDHFKGEKGLYSHQPLPFGMLVAWRHP